MGDCGFYFKNSRKPLESLKQKDKVSDSYSEKFTLVPCGKEDTWRQMWVQEERFSLKGERGSSFPVTAGLLPRQEIMPGAWNVSQSG